MISGRTGGSSWSRWVGSMSGVGHLSLDAVVAYVDGELPPGPAGRAAAHLDRCLTCTGEVAAQRQARRRVRAAGPAAAPTTLLDALRAIPSDAELPALPAGLAVDADGVVVARADQRVHPDHPAGADGPVVPPRRGRRRPGLPVVVGSGVVVGAAALAALAGPVAGTATTVPVPDPSTARLDPGPAAAVTADVASRWAPTPGLPGPGAP